ncbi:hypothetical protein D910_04067 [Dendroctonus ponderosae]|uniref:Fringe-like glycosyltransferase domain-containing protein n=1 Tax=Dendroctonus ponderosae TaxID=77166 RepID=U4U7R5_DENPD|nr:hypothetical protein D910_04067 [Dendroctonus ponderosae]
MPEEILRVDTIGNRRLPEYPKKYQHFGYVLEWMRNEWLVDGLFGLAANTLLLPIALLFVPLKGRPLLKKHIFERTLSQQPSINDQYENGLSTEVSSATATIRPPATTLDDVFISVKTTKSYHSSRLPIILKTWFQLAKRQTWFFTDTDDEEFQLKTNGHMINTNCSSSHNRKALCCKMSVEFDTFLNTDKK